MKRSKRRILPLIEAVEITGVAAEGKAIARVNDQVVFVPYGAPGDVVDVQVNIRKRSYMEGEIVRFHRKSPSRTEPFCEHFGLCGGCRWQHMPYDKQADFKRQQVIDALERIGGFRGIEVEPILKSENTTHYRNKLEFTFTSRRWLTLKELPETGERPEVNFNGLGFYLPGQFDRILDIAVCHLQPEPSNVIRLFVKQRAEQLQIPFYNQRQHQGVLRNIIIRNNTAGDFMVILVVADLDTRVAELLEDLAAGFPRITSVLYTVNDKRNDDLSDRKIVCFSGNSFLIDELHGLKFRIGPKSFWQTNAAQVFHLYSKVIEYAALTGNETVYDLYTGTGSIANIIAGKAKKVVGIEYVKQAVEDAGDNSRLNGISNTTFVSGDIATILNPEFVVEHDTPDVVITDPPRAGMHPDVVRQILGMSPGRIVYVSCNPATQARDVAAMRDMYDISAVQPVDMFPQTHHVENIILLEKRTT